ncbi:hypothetical protein [Streptomyces sp. H27-D2]|uniref:hypothetical protein n=1 Tax=Streptomyces sp. H27-D2 TaxID=3046304 RepID=UPI002DB675C6|nr:hypothetical protein [Streptomyces sp. H27-D2]MEC4016492.1 hypothetical protein [Streptomyces sp. H27-D2]
MGDGIKADLGVIRGMGNGLDDVKKAFDGLSKLTNKYGDDFGDSDLADTFEDFASNWEISREGLTEEVAALGKIAKAAAEAYEEIDSKLAQAIRKAQEPEKGKKGK